MLSSVSLLSIFLSFSLAVARTKNPKRGIGYAGDQIGGDILNANQSNSLISWQYNWDSSPPNYLATSNIKYIPMQWGSAAIDTFADAVEAQGADTILTFNEPDATDQANMDPVDAANLWMQFIEPLKSRGIRLGGPAVSASPTGQPWLTTFMQACGNCTIDFLPIHWYGSGSGGFFDFIWSVHTAFPKFPIWVTEFADITPNDTVVLDFMNQTITYLDGLDWVEKYAWFGFQRSAPNVHYYMLNSDGSLNALGQLYLGAKTVHTENDTLGPTTTFRTVNGADSPTGLPATTWAPLPGSSAVTSQSLHLWLLWAAVIGGLFGTVFA